MCECLREAYAELRLWLGGRRDVVNVAIAIAISWKGRREEPREGVGEDDDDDADVVLAAAVVRPVPEELGLFGERLLAHQDGEDGGLAAGQSRARGT